MKVLQKGPEDEGLIPFAASSMSQMSGSMLRRGTAGSYQSSIQGGSPAPRSSQKQL